jgi:hypothetical protein
MDVTTLNTGPAQSPKNADAQAENNAAVQQDPTAVD